MDQHISWRDACKPAPLNRNHSYTAGGTFQMHGVVRLGLIALLASCQGQLNQRPCPCLAGFICDSTDMQNYPGGRCVATDGGGGSGGGGGGGALDGGIAVIATVSVGIRPSLVAVNEATNKVYVTNEGTNTVSVVDGQTHNVTTVNLPGSTGDVGFVGLLASKTANKAWVANYGSSPKPRNTVTIIDGDNGVTNVTVANNPYALALNETDGALYVTQYGFNGASVSRIVGTTVTSIATTAQPEVIAVNSVTNKVFVTHVSGTLSVIDGATLNVTPVPGGKRADDIALNSTTGRVYIVNHLSNVLTVFDPSTNSVLDNLTVAANLAAVKVDPVRNKIYVSHVGGATEIDGVTHQFTAIPSTDPGGQIALLPGYVTVTIPTLSAVLVRNLNTGATTHINVGTAPSSIAVNPMVRRVYVANSVSNTVSVIQLPAP